MTASVNELELYKEIFEKEPSAIIVLDERGVVKKANDSALKMLNVEALEGRKWYQVIDEVFRPQKDDGQESASLYHIDQKYPEPPSKNPVLTPSGYLPHHDNNGKMFHG